MNNSISISTLSKFLQFSSANDKICATLKKVFDRMTLIDLSYILVIFQLELWREFVKQCRMEHKHVTRLIQIRVAIPVNAGWIQQAYSKLEMICIKRRNKLLVDNIRNEFFVNVLSFPQCSTTEYTEEIKVAAEGKKFPPFQLQFIFSMILLFVMLRHYDLIIY